MQNIILNVEGMSCEHCENRVKKAISSLNGVGSVSVDLKNKTVTIDFDPTQVTESLFKATIEDQGYDVV